MIIISRCILCLVLVLVSCGQSGSHAGDHPSKDSKKPLILVSIAPYQFLVSQIGQDIVEVQTIIPPGANPHAYEPTSRQVLEMAEGQMWFRIGEPFEKKMIAFFRGKNPSLAIHDLRDGLPLIETSGESSHTCCTDHLDRHVWLSPKLAAKQAQTIAAVMADSFPEHKAAFEKNLDACLEQLQALDREIATLLNASDHSEIRSIVVSHPAFAYFCREYHLEQLSVEEEGKEPRPRYLEEILEKARRSHTEVALALPQYNNKGAQLIAKHLQVPVRMINPYAADYLDTMKTLARLIADPYGTIEETP